MTDTAAGAPTVRNVAARRPRMRRRTHSRRHPGSARATRQTGQLPT
ncbi:hypothetical protein [Lysobacter gummosus]